MEYLIINIFLILMLIILAFVCDVNVKKLKKFAETEESKLNNITKKYPSNIEICKHILKKLNNNNVKIEEDKNYQSCLYIAISNKIIIADVKESFTRIQTIAHECLHSIQNRKMLLFNFIFSNIYILYFIIITIMGIFKILPYKHVFLALMFTLSYIYYFIRSYLEMDAMTKARFIAKEYMQELQISSKEEIDIIVNSYDKLNDIGIKMTNYQLMFETIIKTIIVGAIFFIR